jgi:hypothetical protein
MGSEGILKRLAEGCGVDPFCSGRDRWRPLVNMMMNLRVLAPRIFLLVS